MLNFEIHQLAMWQDNYIYILHEKQTNTLAVIDPGDADIVQTFLKQHNLSLNMILISHHHPDHVAGVLKLKQTWSCPVYGFENDTYRIPEINKPLKEGDMLAVGNLKFKILHVPGHTLGHILFWNKTHNIVFCGDTLFAMGCGRLFEGTAKQMFLSLNKIKKLPGKSLIYCAHEYSLKNAEFSLKLHPKNMQLIKRVKKIQNLRKQNRATVPFMLQDDLVTNPFLMTSCLKEFTRIRKLRDLA